MALMPKRVKYRKQQRGNRRGIATTGSQVDFGEFGLKVLENGWLKNTQIEAVRVILARQLHKGGKLWIRVFPDKSITKKKKHNVAVCRSSFFEEKQKMGRTNQI